MPPRRKRDQIGDEERPPAPSPLPSQRPRDREDMRQRRRLNPAGTPPASPLPYLPPNTPPMTPSSQFQNLLLGGMPMPVAGTPQGQIIQPYSDRIAYREFVLRPQNLARDQRVRDYLVSQGLMPHNPADAMRLGGRPVPMDLYLTQLAEQTYDRQRAEERRQIREQQMVEEARQRNRMMVQQRMANARRDDDYYIGTPPITPPLPPVAGTPPATQINAPPPLRRGRQQSSSSSTSSSPTGVDDVFNFGGSGMRVGRLARYYKK